MKAVIQRVSHPSVTVNQQVISKIKSGLLIFLGIAPDDDDEAIDWLVKKIANLRIFNDNQGVMNLSIKDTNANAIIVSQFTLLASTKKGNRPSYINAARPEIAIPIYQKFIQDFESELGKKVGTGEFGADMKINLLNDGPVTIVINSKIKE